MKKFYITFGSEHLKDFNLPSHIRRAALAIEVEAATEWEARQKIIDTCIRTNFCTSYTEEDIDRLISRGFYVMDLKKLFDYKGDKMLKEKVVIISHKNCIDGLASASIMQNFYEKKGFDTEVLFLQYSEEIKTIEELKKAAYKISEIIFTDFSFKAPEMITLCNYFKTIEIIVFDHHKTAEHELEIAKKQCSNLKVLFDNTKSGAKICWDYCISNEESLKEKYPEWIYNYIQDRDLWEWNLPDSKYINEAIRFNVKANDIQSFINFCKETSSTKLIETGKILEKKTNQMVEDKISKIKILKVKEFEVVCINATENLSELGNALCLKYNKPALMFFFTEDLKVVCSLRSTDDLEDISVLAKSFPGGGGHRNAAGFTIDFYQLGQLLLGNL